MDEQLNDDRLDALLREEMPYIDDNGFTARVAHQLPAPRQRRSMRALILLGMTLLAAALAYVASGDGAPIAEGFTRLALMPMPLLISLALLCGLLVTAGGVAAALSKANDRIS
jgi:hypothetical protein